MNDNRQSTIPNTPLSPYYSEDHEAFRDTLRRFVDKEVMPHAAAWDEAEEFPRELYKKAAEIGAIGFGYPEDLGGVPADLFYTVILNEEFARPGVGGIMASLFSHSIGTPPIVALGSEDLKRRVVPEILAGEKISALAITEPSGGSDVANLKTRAVRDGDDYVLNGSKTFITSGMRADYYTVAVRTGGEGIAGISLILVERDRPGFERTLLNKMGWWCSDTATLYFDDYRVPAGNLLGVENEGFRGIMLNFNSERFGIAAMAHGLAKTCLEEAVSYAHERQTFGQPLIKHQAIRHKLIDMATRVNALKATMEALAWRLEQGESPVAEICMLKNQSTETLQFCASEGVQVLGGAGYLRGAKVERIYRETKVLAIGGGAEEIMKDLASRQLGW